MQFISGPSVGAVPEKEGHGLWWGDIWVCDTHVSHRITPGKDRASGLQPQVGGSSPEQTRDVCQGDNSVSNWLWAGAWMCQQGRWKTSANVARTTSFNQQEEMRNIKRLWKSKQWKHFFVNLHFGYVSQWEEAWSPDSVSWSQSRVQSRALAQHRAGTSPRWQSCCDRLGCAWKGWPSSSPGWGSLSVPQGKWRKGRDILTFSINGNAKLTVEVHLNSKVGSGSLISKWLSVLETWSWIWDMPSVWRTSLGSVRSSRCGQRNGKEYDCWLLS